MVFITPFVVITLLLSVSFSLPCWSLFSFSLPHQSHESFCRVRMVLFAYSPSFTLLFVCWFWDKKVRQHFRKEWRGWQLSLSLLGVEHKHMWGNSLLPSFLKRLAMVSFSNLKNFEQLERERVCRQDRTYVWGWSSFLPPLPFLTCVQVILVIQPFFQVDIFLSHSGRFGMFNLLCLLTHSLPFHMYSFIFVFPPLLCVLCLHHKGKHEIGVLFSTGGGGWTVVLFRVFVLSAIEHNRRVKKVHLYFLFNHFDRITWFLVARETRKS